MVMKLVKKTAVNRQPVATKALPKKTVAAKKAASKKVAATKVTKNAAPKAAPKAAEKKIVKKTVAVKKALAKTARTGKSPTKKAPVKAAATQKAAPKKTGAKTAAAKNTTWLGYDPRTQLDKLSKFESRGGDDAPAVDINAVLAEFFALRRDEPLTPEVYAKAADDLGVEIAALRAIAAVESGGGGFDNEGRPKILYERQVFSRSCAPKGKFDAAHGDLSAPKGYGPGGYGTSAAQWPKLARAYQLDGDAALKACSWGTYQILGENHKASGFADVRSFVAEMFASPAGHVRALVGFIRSNPAIHKGLKGHDWAAVARGYNGPTYKQFNYDTKLQAAYEKFKAQG